MKYSVKLIKRLFLCFCLFLYLLGEGEIRASVDLAKTIDTVLSVIHLIVQVGLVILIADILTLRNRLRKRVIRNGKKIKGKIVKVAYPLTTYRSKDGNVSFGAPTIRGLGGNREVYTLQVAYEYEGKGYSRESGMRTCVIGQCPYQQGEWIDIYLMPENPEEFVFK